MNRENYQLYTGKLLLHTGTIHEVLTMILALTDFYEGGIQYEIIPVGRLEKFDFKLSEIQKATEITANKPL